MTFDELIAVAQVGDVVEVRDGASEPGPNSSALNLWRSRNYSGEVVEVQESSIIIAGQVSPPVKSRTHIARAGDGLTFNLPQNLGAQKSITLSRIAARRWAAQTNMIYDGVGPVSYGADTAGNIVATLQALAMLDAGDPEGAPHTTPWKLGPGAFRVWTASELQAFGFALHAYIGACFAREGELAAEVAAAGDLEALAGIDIDAGWPVTGGGE